MNINLQRIQEVLSVIGGIVVGLPAFLHALRAFLKLIPGDPGDNAVAKVESVSQKIAGVVNKSLPQSPPAQE